MRFSRPVVSLVTIPHVVKFVQVRHQSVTPMGPCLSVGPVVALLPDPHVGSLAAENISEPAPSVCSFLFLVSGPDNLSLALPVRLWWTTRCLGTLGPVVIGVLQFTPVDRVKSGHVGSRLRATQIVSIYRTYRRSNPRKASFRLLFETFPVFFPKATRELFEPSKPRKPRQLRGQRNGQHISDSPVRLMMNVLVYKHHFPI